MALHKILKTPGAIANIFNSSCQDHYSTYSELALVETEGKDYKVITHITSSSIAIIAIHGGRIEPGTSEIARSLAEDGNKYSFYLFEGHKSENNRLLHITSTHFDEPRALALAAKVERLVSVHGMKGEEPFVLMGGLDTSLRERIKIRLKESGFQVKEGMGSLEGAHPSNITNRCNRHAGVQLEISQALRRLFFGEPQANHSRWSTRQAPLFRFVSAVQMAIDECQD